MKNVGRWKDRNVVGKRRSDPAFLISSSLAGGANESANRREYLQIEIFAENPQLTTIYVAMGLGINQ